MTGEPTMQRFASSTWFAILAAICSLAGCGSDSSQNAAHVAIQRPSPLSAAKLRPVLEQQAAQILEQANFAKAEADRHERLLLSRLEAEMLEYEQALERVHRPAAADDPIAIRFQNWLTARLRLHALSEQGSDIADAIARLGSTDANTPAGAHDVRRVLRAFGEEPLESEDDPLLRDQIEQVALNEIREWLESRKEAELHGLNGRIAEQKTVLRDATAVRAKIAHEVEELRTQQSRLAADLRAARATKCQVDRDLAAAQERLAEEILLGTLSLRPQLENIFAPEPKSIASAQNATRHTTTAMAAIAFARALVEFTPRSRAWTDQLNKQELALLTWFSTLLSRSPAAGVAVVELCLERLPTHGMLPFLLAEAERQLGCTDCDTANHNAPDRAEAISQLTLLRRRVLANPSEYSEPLLIGALPRRTLNSLEQEFLLVRPGTFEMGFDSGSNDGEDESTPLHRPHIVTMSRPYYLARYETTQGQYEKVLGSNPAFFDESFHGSQSHPVEMVSFHCAVRFAEQLTRLPAEATTGRRYRLPTEAEWEFAACGGPDSYAPINASSLGDHIWFGRNSGGRTHSAGTREPTALGFVDMYGNVQEWTTDWFGPYSSNSAINPNGPVSGTQKVLRGGSYEDDLTMCNPVARSAVEPDTKFRSIGFRIVLEISPRQAFKQLGLDEE